MSDIKDAVWECFDNNGINFDNGDPVSAAADITQYIEQQLKQAHRAAEESAKDAYRRGWEQCQREAVVVANKRYMATDIIEGCGRVWCSAFGQLMKDINAMEYKEPTND